MLKHEGLRVRGLVLEERPFRPVGVQLLLPLAGVPVREPRLLRVFVYAVYAVSSLDTGLPLRRRSRMAVGTYQGVAGLAPRPFTLGEETGSHHGHGHVHRTRMLICMHNWGSSLHLPPHRRSSIVIGARARMHPRGP